MPCAVLKLAASPFDALCIKAFPGIVPDSASAVMGTLRYSWLLTAFWVLGMMFSSHVSLVRYSWTRRPTSSLKTKRFRC